MSRGNLIRSLKKNIVLRKNTIDVITLGCSKNLVDSEKLMRQLEANGYKVTHDTDRPQGEIAVINTCGFIGDAKEESINMILEFCQAKEEGRLKKLFVMGCLSERYLKELGEEIPQVDKFYGKFDWNELLTDLGKAYHQELSLERELTTPSHYAYLKISEGCDRRCSYCAIPIITGKHVSRPIEDILDEVRMLVSRGVKEFQVIAQELTYYGLDLYHRQMLPELIERMADIPGVDWIRLHYAYPANFPVDLFRVMREKKNVCKYMDIALQHISDNMLQRMHRHVTRQETYALDKLMALQQKISADLAAQKIGKIFKVIIDRSEGEYYIGRTEFDSPEVDPEVLIPVSEGTLSLGTFYEVKITDADDFDLYGTRMF